MGFQWDFMGFHGVSMGFHGGFNGIPMGFQWDFMVLTNGIRKGATNKTAPCLIATQMVECGLPRC